jgi:hypothetical protein
MSRGRLGRDAEAALARMDAEDRARRYLNTLPRQVAEVAAVKAAVELAAVWEVEKSEMLRRGDPRPVYLSTARERFWLNSAAAKYCLSSDWQRFPEDYLLRLFAVLPPDTAAFVACRVAIWVCEWRI